MIALAAGAFYALIKAPGWYVTLPQATQATVGGVAAAVLVPTIAYISTRSLDRARMREEAIRPQKTQLYDDAISGFMGVINSGTLDSKKTRRNTDALLNDITARLTTYGDRRVIRRGSRSFRIRA